jgi:hypothetical protein
MFAAVSGFYGRRAFPVLGIFFGLISMLASPDAASCGELTGVLVVVTARATKATGDSCPMALVTELKNAGADVTPHPSGDSVLSLNGKLSLPVGMDVPGLQPSNAAHVSEIQITIEPWWPYRSIRNASHFAKVMFSEPWKEIQRKETTQPYSAVSWGYHRAVLTAGSLKPLVDPTDVREKYDANDDPQNEWAKADPFRSAESENYLSDFVDSMSAHPYNNFIYGTSHQLLDRTDAKSVKNSKFVALSTSNVLVDTMKLQTGASVTRETVAVMQAAMDRAALACSKINAERELAEMKQLQATRTLSPVDIDAFQNQRRKEISRYSSREPQLFDAIQALK